MTGRGDCVDARNQINQGPCLTDSGVDQADAKAHSNSFKYNLKYPSLGQCVIINNKNFQKRTGMGVRNGTDVDAKNVMGVFSKLGFKIKITNDQTVSQMKDLLTKVSQEDHSHSAMFVCVLLSHGDDGVIYGTDGCIELKELFKLFRGDQCSTLITESRELKNLKRENSKLNSAINQKRTRLLEANNDFIKEKSKLTALQKEHDELEQRLRALREGKSFLSNLQDLNRRYLKHRIARPDELETYGPSCMPAMLLESRCIMGTEQQLKTVNDQLQQIIDETEG